MYLRKFLAQQMHQEKVVTEISEAGLFGESVADDQDYFRRCPEGCAPLPARQGVAAAER